MEIKRKSIIMKPHALLPLYYVFTNKNALNVLIQSHIARLFAIIVGNIDITSCLDLQVNNVGRMKVELTRVSNIDPFIFLFTSKPTTSPHPLALAKCKGVEPKTSLRLTIERDKVICTESVDFENMDIRNNASAPPPPDICNPPPPPPPPKSPVSGAVVSHFCNNI